MFYKYFLGIFDLICACLHAIILVYCARYQYLLRIRCTRRRGHGLTPGDGPLRCLIRYGIALRIYRRVLRAFYLVALKSDDVRKGTEVDLWIVKAKVVLQCRKNAKKYHDIVD